MQRLTAAVVTVISSSILVAACSSSPAPHATPTAHVSTSTVPKRLGDATVPIAPAGDFYRPPNPLPPGRPGQVIWAQRVGGINFSPPQTVWRFLYHSRDQSGRDVAVSAFAIVPKSAAPKAGRPVYAWAHGTSGLGDQCAPSKAIREYLPPYAGEVANGSALVVATDYEGLGTPGDHTYLVGRPEGQAVLDSVRAAAALPNAGSLGNVVVAGQSQGGGAALFAAQLAPTYAPELHIQGVFASAPAAELGTIATAEQTSPFKGILLMAAAGLRAAYPGFDPSAFLTPSAEADLSRVAHECVDTTINRYKNRSATDIITTDPSHIGAIARILGENSPGAVSPDVPVMIVQGQADEQIPVAVSAALAAKYCALNTSVVRRIFAGASHDGVLDAAHDDAIAWINARYRQLPAPTTCRPPIIQVRDGRTSRVANASLLRRSGVCEIVDRGGTIELREGGGVPVRKGQGDLESLPVGRCGNEPHRQSVRGRRPVTQPEFLD